MGELATVYAGRAETAGSRPVELTDIGYRLFSSFR